ncbi:MAG: POT family MFS transporter [Planctomycetaceae bacterium]|nr:POT family MFS transporter [Planctomycetaceae bacterium]
MANSYTTYRTAPTETTGMPGGIPFIIGNEAAERFSFYGMKVILAIFMTQYLLSSAGEAAYLTDTQAREYVHLFVASAYFFPVIGAIVADAFLGKYRTIMLLSIVYCLGHGALALIDMPGWFLSATMEPKGWLVAGLFLIALGSGGIKPCVSAHVGDQFGKSNSHLLSRVFGWFYFSINFGSFFSTLLTPWLLKNYGPGWAFGVPGILMALATLVFWLGRHRYIHIPPKGFGFVRETFSREGLGAMAGLISIYAFVAVFWSLYDQSGGAWVLQAAQMDCNFLGIQWLESQVQAINPLLILCYIPLFAYVVYPIAGKFVKLTALRKIGAGFFLCVVAFGISAYAQQKIDVAQSAFADKVTPMVASSGINYEATITELKSIERNASARDMETLLKDAQPADTAWQSKMAKSLSVGGIAIASDGTRHDADWPSIAWQLLAYIVLTAAEVLVSVTCLEFSYTQAPKKMKSFIMSLYLLSVSAGNFLTAAVNNFTQDADGNSTLTGASYYWFFTYLMLGAAVVYIFVSLFYREKEYIQTAEDAQA